MEIVSTRLGRTFSKVEKIRKVIQSIFHMVNNGHHVLAVGWIQPDGTVKGGTGWGVELAKLFNRPLHVYDQDRRGWFAWKDGAWVAEAPVLVANTFVGTGTRNLTEDAGPSKSFLKPASAPRFNRLECFFACLRGAAQSYRNPLP